MRNSGGFFLLTLFRGVERPVKQEIGLCFGVADIVFESWLRSLSHVRNICV